MTERPDLRASDEQRDRAAAEIRDHYAAGRLTEDEFNERLDAAYGARTQGELAELRRDLPALSTRNELAERRRRLRGELIQETGGAFVPFAMGELNSVQVGNAPHRHGTCSGRSRAPDAGSVFRPRFSWGG